MSKRFIKTLPFSLTRAQNRVIEEILSDMQNVRVMNRLVQGDVGSGKTIVAAIAMLVAADSGAQAAMMAPTENLHSSITNLYAAIWKKWGLKYPY
jgi:ATP-dependent DNA helicase RecG